MTSITLDVFFFNDTATTEIYTLSLHDALPISHDHRPFREAAGGGGPAAGHARGRAGDARHPAGLRSRRLRGRHADRKSTRLNSSHANISYAVFCLKKKKRE